MNDHEERLRAILRADPVLWPALTTLRRLDLPDSWIVSGALYNTVWNHLTGRPPGYGLKDIDVFYHDPDTSWDAEDAVIARARAHFTGPVPVEVRNQARVHLWYPDHFGRRIAPLRSSAESLSAFACETHAVAARLKGTEIEIAAPYGLDSVFSLRIVPNIRHRNRRTHEAKAARCRANWPEVVVEDWPALAVVEATRLEDWHAVHALVSDAFAGMEGRIDPPSSLTRMTPTDLARLAEDGACLVAHDGTALLGCAFLSPRSDTLYVGKVAVRPDRQGAGIGRALMQRAEAYARSGGLASLELQTRVELTENHTAFARLGFVETGRTAHPGFDRPTSITMRKAL